MPRMPDEHAPRTRLVVLLREVRDRWSDDPPDAVRHLEEALADPDGPTAGAWEPGERARLEARLGQLRIFLGRLDEAVGSLRRAVGRHDDPYLALQLAAALRWRGGAQAWTQGADLAEDARAAAAATRSGPLAIAAHCLLGDIALERGRPDAAVRDFGAALGISEFASSDAVTVVPLAGLATAHFRGRAPRKSASLARRALERAQRVGDRAGQARALLALAEAEGDVAGFGAAADMAERAPHRPLALAAKVAAAERLGAAPDDLLAEALECGTRDLAARIRRIADSGV